MIYLSRFRRVCPNVGGRMQSRTIIPYRGFGGLRARECQYLNTYLMKASWEKKLLTRVVSKNLPR